MLKDKEIYGVDVSKDMFDVYSKSQGHVQFKNDSQGFKDLVNINKTLE